MSVDGCHWRLHESRPADAAAAWAGSSLVAPSVAALLPPRRQRISWVSDTACSPKHVQHRALFCSCLLNVVLSVCRPAQVYLDNVTAEYYNPEPLDSCEQFTTKTVFGFQQAFGANNVTATANRTAGRIIGPVNITVLVLDASDNRTGARGHTVGKDCLLVLHVSTGRLP